MSRRCLKKAWRTAVITVAFITLIGCSNQNSVPLTQKAASEPSGPNGASAEAVLAPSAPSKEASAQPVAGKTEPSSSPKPESDASKGQAEGVATAGKEPGPAAMGAESASQPQTASTATSQGSPTETAPAASASAPEANPKSAVLLRIQGDQEKGTILAETSVEIQAGDTVIDVLKRVTKEKKIQLETRGKGPAAYVEGIANLYEFDKGSKSGWLFRVNGKFPNSSAGAVAVHSGDRVEWVYTLDLGKDVGKDPNAGSGG